MLSSITNVILVLATSNLVLSLPIPQTTAVDSKSVVAAQGEAFRTQLGEILPNIPLAQRKFSIFDNSSAQVCKDILTKSCPICDDNLKQCPDPKSCNSIGDGFLLSAILYSDQNPGYPSLNLTLKNTTVKSNPAYTPGCGFYKRDQKSSSGWTFTDLRTVNEKNPLILLTDIKKNPANYEICCAF